MSSAHIGGEQQLELSAVNPILLGYAKFVLFSKSLVYVKFGCKIRIHDCV